MNDAFIGRSMAFSTYSNGWMRLIAFGLRNRMTAALLFLVNWSLAPKGEREGI